MKKQQLIENVQQWSKDRGLDKADIGDLSENFGPRTNKRNIQDINRYLQIISIRYGTTLEACLKLA